MRPTLLYMFLLTLSLAAAVSCNEERELTIADQEAAIDAYITQNYSEYPVVRRNGSNRIDLDTAAVEAIDTLVFGDTLHFYYAGYVFTSAPSALFATNSESVAEANSFTVTDPDFSVEEVVFTEDCLVNGLVNGLYGVREGGHYIILFSAKYGFYNSYVYNIPKMSALIYEIWVERVIKKD